MQALALPQLRPFAKWAPLVLRLGIGIVMAVNGWKKLQPGTDGMWLSGQMLVDNFGYPTSGAAFFAWLVMLAELLGGLALILGLFTRLSAILVAIVMVVAILTVKAKMGLVAAGGGGAQLDVALLVGALALAFWGSGELALDRMLGIDPGD